MTPASALAEGVSALRLDVPMHAQAKLLDYLELLSKWNRTHNLTAIRDPARMITHHLLDSLATLEYLGPHEETSCLDVGSGGGLPGIPLAIVRPEWRVTLLDSNRKKTTFLQQAVIEMGLANVEVVTERVEDYQPMQRFTIAISRAFSDLATFAAAARLLRPGGRLVAMKGLIPSEQIDALPSNVRLVETHELHVPGVEGKRHLVIMEAIVR